MNSVENKEKLMKYKKKKKKKGFEMAQDMNKSGIDLEYKQYRIYMCVCCSP